MADLTDPFEEFREMEPWFLKLAMTPLRTKAHQTRAITFEEKQTLEAMVGQGPQTHNAALLDMVRAADSREAFKRLAQAVKLLGPTYKPKYDKMMAIHDLGKGVGPASTSTNPAVSGADASAAGAHASQPRAVNGWKSQTYHRNYELLLMRMHPQDVRNKCKALSLLGDYELADVDAEGISHKKNAIILKVLESSPGLFGTFREILHCITNCRDIAKELDAVGPNRTTDQDCLDARNVLEKCGNVSTD